MKSNRSDYLIATGVLVCSAVVLVALTFALSGWKPTRHTRVLHVDFPDVTGIRVHSPVRYAGAPAGKVSGFRLLSDEERNATNWSAVRVTIELFDDTPPLPDDVRASLGADTLLSEKFVALSAGSPDRPKLPDGAVLLGAGAAGLETLIDSVGPLVQQLQTTLAGFDSVVVKTGSTVDTLRDGLGDALPRISSLADSLKTTADTASGALKRIDEMVADVDPLLKIDLAKLSGSLDELQKTLSAARELLKGTDQQISGRMAELSVVLQNLKVVSTHAKSLAKTLAEKPNRLIFSGKPPVLPTEQEVLRSNKPVPVR